MMGTHPSTAAPATPVPAIVDTTQGAGGGVVEGEGLRVCVAAGVGVAVGVAPCEGVDEGVRSVGAQ